MMLDRFCDYGVLICCINQEISKKWRLLLSLLHTTCTPPTQLRDKDLKT